jgi:hypothetical protein
MGLFTRKRPAEGAANGHSQGAAPKASHENRQKHQKEKFDIDSGYYNRRPTFGQWLK